MGAIRHKNLDVLTSETGYSKLTPVIINNIDLTSGEYTILDGNEDSLFIVYASNITKFTLPANPKNGGRFVIKNLTGITFTVERNTAGHLIDDTSTYILLRKETMDLIFDDNRFLDLTKFDKGFAAFYGSSDLWTLQHNLGRYPSVQIAVSGEIVFADITHTNTSYLEVSFKVPTSGLLIIN